MHSVLVGEATKALVVSEIFALLCRFVPNDHQVRSGISCDGKNLRRWHSKNAKHTGFELLSARYFAWCFPFFLNRILCEKNVKSLTKKTPRC
jgi:hypothetical protein